MKQSKHFPDLYLRSPVAAFQNAIERKVFTDIPDSRFYAGDWMYMHTESDGRDAFKNVNTRQYIWVQNIFKLGEA